MENTTYDTEKTVVFINKQFNYQIRTNILIKLHHIHSNYDLLNFDNTRNEIDTYFLTKKKITINHIYKFAKENYDLFTSKIQDLTGDEFAYYRINGKDVRYINKAGIDSFYSEQPVYDKVITNANFAFYCSYIINYIDEILANFTKATKEAKGRTEKQTKYTTFESMFSDATKAEKVIRELIGYETLNPQGELIKPFYEVLAITEALKMSGIIKIDVNKTTRNTLLGNKIKAEFSERATRANSKNHEELITNYKDLFSSIK